MTSDALALSPDVIAVRTGVETVVWVPCSGALHLLDAVGTAVVELCDGRRTVDAVVAELARASGSPAWRVRKEASRLLQELRRAAVLVPIVT